MAKWPSARRRQGFFLIMNLCRSFEASTRIRNSEDKTKFKTVVTKPRRKKRDTLRPHSLLLFLLHLPHFFASVRRVQDKVSVPYRSALRDLAGHEGCDQKDNGRREIKAIGTKINERAIRSDKRLTREGSYSKVALQPDFWHDRGTRFNVLDWFQNPIIVCLASDALLHSTPTGCMLAP